MQLKAERDPLLDGLQTAARALSTRTTLPSLGGIMLVSDGRQGGRPRDRRRARGHASSSTPRSTATARSCSPAGCSPTSPGRCRRGPSTLERAQGQGRRRADRRHRELPSAPARPRGLPAASRARRRRPEDAGRSAGGDGRAGRARRLARRGAADPDRDHGQRRGIDPDDGRHRLLPAQRQADRARGGGSDAVRGERAGAGDARAGAGRLPERPRGGRDRAARQPDRLPGRQRDAVLAADRGPVPELPPAAARTRSTTTSGCRGRSCST